MSGLRDQRGFTLVEVLIVSVLMLVVMGATLTTFSNMERGSKRNRDQSEQAEVARAALDRIARQLRNLAKRDPGQVVIAKATADDFAFQTSNPERTWMRYCVEPMTGGYGRMREYESRTGVGGTGSCSSALDGWASNRVVADKIVNLAESRRTFSYVCSDRGAIGCPRAGVIADLSRVVGVTMQLSVDLNRRLRPAAMLVTSGVFLRNQNEEPQAAFSATRTTARTVLLNGSGSVDPEGRTLRYYWFVGAAPAVDCKVGVPATTPHYHGPTASYTAPTAPMTISVTLVVCDPGDLQARITKDVRIT